MAEDKAEGGSEVWTIQRVLLWATGDLKTRGSSSPRLDAELMLCLALSVDRIALVVDASRPLSKDELARYRELHKRRRGGEPIAYLRGEREFFGRSFRVDPRVLVPRPETEFLIEVALKRTSHVSLGCRTLDLCTGSGCVAVTLACERPNNRVWATDLSADALVVAEHNAYRQGAHRIAFFQGDLFAALPRGARFDLLVANAPYIARAEIETLAPDVRNFEPRLALDGGGDGLDVLRRLCAEAPAFLDKSGVIALEIGADQGESVPDLLREAGFLAIEVRRDYAGLDRVVSATWRG